MTIKQLIEELNKVPQQYHDCEVRVEFWLGDYPESKTPQEVWFRVEENDYNRAESTFVIEIGR